MGGAHDSMEANKKRSAGESAAFLTCSQCHKEKGRAGFSKAELKKKRERLDGLPKEEPQVPDEASPKRICTTCKVKKTPDEANEYAARASLVCTICHEDKAKAEFPKMQRKFALREVCKCASCIETTRPAKAQKSAAESDADAV